MVQCSVYVSIVNTVEVLHKFRQLKQPINLSVIGHRRKLYFMSNLGACEIPSQAVYWEGVAYTTYVTDLTSFLTEYCTYNKMTRNQTKLSVGIYVKCLPVSTMTNIPLLVASY